MPIILLLAACNNPKSPQTPDSSFNLQEVQVYIHEVNKKYGDRFTTDDSLMYKERYCKEVVIFPAQHPTLQGREAVRNYYYDNGKNVNLTTIIQATNIYGSADLVVEEGTYDFPDGQGGSYDKGKFIALWKQEEGKWKLYREIWNTDVEMGSIKIIN